MSEDKNGKECIQTIGFRVTVRDYPAGASISHPTINIYRWPQPSKLSRLIAWLRRKLARDHREIQT